MNLLYLYKVALIGAISSIAVTTQSCSDDDEILEPSTGYVDNKFVVPADATGPEADMRREFYKETGINLLFSEILEREYIGKDAFGDDVWKEHTVDFRYGLTSMNTDGPEFTEYQTIDEKAKAVEFVKQYVLPHISGSSLTPFSILLVDNLKAPKYGSWGDLADMSYTSCWRCTAFAMKDILNMSEADKKQLASEICTKIIEDKFDSYCDEMDDFYNLDTSVYRVRISTIDPSWDRSDYTILYEHGLLSPYLNYSGYVDRDQFYYWDSDVYDDYFEALMTRDEADFKAEFAAYPLVIERYDILKSSIENVGYKF